MNNLPVGAGVGEIHALGERALLVETTDAQTARSLALAVGAASVPGVLDTVVGLTTLLITLTPDAEPDVVSAVVAALDHGGSGAADGRRIVIPVVFDGPDLEEVAHMVGLSVSEVVAALCQATLEVAVVGFSPGFGYLRGLPDSLAHVARRDRPRPAVPAGSVALAGGYCGIYPQATPGGWQLVGRTTQALFDADRPPYSLLAPGDEVQFVALDEAEAAPGSPQVRARDPLVAPSGSRPGFLVERPGPLSTVQDLGREGVAHLGVPHAGPADPVSHELANRLVGNDPAEAALEVTVTGPELFCRSAGYLAVVGEVALTLDGKEVAANRVVPFASGQRLVLGPLRRGLRAYVAVAGGLAVPQVLASSSTDQLSGTGPGVLRSGDEIGFGRPDGPMGDHLAPGRWGTSSDEESVLRVLEGPHGRWFAEDAMARLSARRFVVGQASNRVGTRLEGLEAGGGIDRLAEELPSQGMVTGAVQVPPDGMPVVLGPDHGVLGGYPVLAVVIQADLGRLGQCRPGQGVRLVPIDRAEAADAAFRLRRFLGEAVVGRYPVQPA